MSQGAGAHQQSGSGPAPRVSVGMPAYNGEATIGFSIDSILAQTFGDFELIVSDNASTDRTWSIVQEYAQRDPRVRAIRQPSNIGANGNYSATFKAARGRYFKWASSNDWCAPEFLEHCVTYLEAHPDTVLVAPGTRLFESDLAQCRDYADDIACTQADPLERLEHVVKTLALNNVINGLCRSEALARTRLIEHYPRADVVLVGHLALLGRIALLPQPLFYRRMDAKTATRMMSADAVHRHHYPVDTWRSVLPAWRLSVGWAQAALSSGLSPRNAARALFWVLRQGYWQRSQLGNDMIDLARFLRRR